MAPAESTVTNTMQLPTPICAIFFLALTAHANTVQGEDGIVCGDFEFAAADVDLASNTACEYVRDGETAGDSNYPHRYNNFEGFYFHGYDGPFFEFPLLESRREYSGGKWSRYRKNTCQCRAAVDGVLFHRQTRSSSRHYYEGM